MADMTHEDIERIWNSFSHYLPDRQKSDAAVDFISTLKSIDVEINEIKAAYPGIKKLEMSDSYSSNLVEKISKNELKKIIEESGLLGSEK